MKHWARVTTLGLVLGLATSGCNDPAAAESPPAADPATPPAADVTHRAGETAPSDDDGGGFFLKRRKPSTPAGTSEHDGPPKSHAGGLGGLTRELVATARRTVGDPVRLVPDAAHYVMRARPAVLFAHPEATAVWAKAEASDASFKNAMDVVRACLGTLEAVDDLVLGFDDAEHVMMVVHAKGLGTEPTWRCIQTETTTRGKTFDLAITGTPRGEGPQLRSNDGDGLVWFPDDDTVVMASTAWEADAQARLRGEGTAAVDGRLAGTMVRVHQDDPLWLAGRITGLPEAGLAGTPMAGIDDVAVDMRLEGVDMLVTTSVDAGEAADATRVREAVQKQVDDIKSILPAVGLPASIGPKLSFVAKGDVVELELSLTGDELRSMREGIERTF